MTFGKRKIKTPGDVNKDWSKIVIKEALEDSSSMTKYEKLMEFLSQIFKYFKNDL